MADKKPRRSDTDIVSFSEFTGLRNDVGAERFEPTDLVVGDNVDIDKSGRIARRTGHTLRYASPCHSVWAKDALGLFASGTQLLRLNTDFSATVLLSSLTPDRRVSFSAVNDSVFFSNGMQTGLFDAVAGTTRSWGLAVPALPATTVVGGNLPAGDYQFTATYMRADGQESGARQAGVVTLGANQSIQFDFPAGPADADSKNIYLSPPNGDMLYLLTTLPNATTSYTPAAADIAQLNLPLLTQFMQAAPAGQLVQYYKGRVFVAVGDTLYMSEPYGYELFDLRKYIVLDAPITMLAVIEDRDGGQSGFFIGTERSSGALIGNGPDDFQYVPKTDYGVIFGAVDYAEGSLFGDNSVGARLLPVWLSVQGICVGLPDMTVQNLTRTKFSTAPLTGPGAALFIPGVNRFIGVSSADPAYVIHTETMALWTYSEFPFNSLAYFDGHLIGATSTGVFELVGDTDDGAPINSVVRTGTTDFNTAHTKKVDRVYVGYRGAGALLLHVTADETVTHDYPLPLLRAGIHGDRVKLGRGLNARYWQFEVRNVNGAYFELDRIDIQPLQNKRRVGGAA